MAGPKPSHAARQSSHAARPIAVAVAGAALLGAVMPAALAGVTPAGGTPAATPQVLRVGTYDGIAGQFTTVQAAVDAARPGDWVLVGPGDYKTTSSRPRAGVPTSPAGVLVTTPDIHLRGMDRNAVILDGTHAGAPCNAVPADQSFGPAGKSGPLGLNGVMVWKADDVSVENLTACNFLAGSGGDTGNEIWWNGGANSAQIGGWGFTGAYLNATSTFYRDETSAAQYGIFSSNWSGGTWDHTYASNFNDSGYYIGACQDQCDQTVNHAWSQYSALGYSGSNSGGQLVIENSEFDHNEDGFDTNSQNGDNPPPQDGACPGNTISPITHTHSCWVFMHNYVHDNNNPDVPALGSAAAGPVGTGMSLSGARNDTVMDNVFARNGAWGAILVPYPDNGPPCTGGTNLSVACVYDEWGDAIVGNTFSGNGFFGNVTNGDIAAVNLEPGPPDCFRGNTERGGGSASTSPPGLEALFPSCTGSTTLPDLNLPFLDQVACDSQSASIGPVSAGTFCLPGTNYPRRTKVIMHPLPSGLPSMPQPCAGVPANPWCPAGGSASLGEHGSAAPARTYTSGHRAAPARPNQRPAGHRRRSARTRPPGGPRY